MQLISADKITIPPRQRKERPAGHIKNLKQSILTKGLLHAPVISQSGNLVAGECRLTALQELHEDGLQFFYDGKIVPKNQIPFVTIAELSEDDLAEAEFEENMFRAALTWLEISEAKALIHRLRTAKNPDQTFAATAREILKTQKGIDITTLDKEAAKSTTYAEAEHLRKAVLIDANKHDPRVRAAKSTHEAVNIILDAATKKLKRQMIETGVVSSTHKVIKGDCLEVMPTLQSGTFDLIFCDPPYGIGMDKMKRTEKHHYDDSPEKALNLCAEIIREGFRLLKPKGHLFMFHDPEHFSKLHLMAEMQAYTVWRTPLIWWKGNVGHAPWGRAGFIHTYENILFAVKGQKFLSEPGGADVLSYKRVARNEKVHAAEKPVELLKHLLKASSLPGDHILDPCCGSGSILDAASSLKMHVTAIEIDDIYHAEACARLTGDVEIEDFRDDMERFEEDVLGLEP